MSYQQSDFAAEIALNGMIHHMVSEREGASSR